jgi:hypothetical protein
MNLVFISQKATFLNSVFITIIVFTFIIPLRYILVVQFEGHCVRAQWELLVYLPTARLLRIKQNLFPADGVFNVFRVVVRIEGDYTHEDY